MTGAKNGVTGRMTREVNPYIINVHCIAHRLALVTSQAANNIDYLKKYQTALANVYYYFKGSHSGNRSANLEKIFQVLDSPEISVKETHSVRWFSFYAALEAIYITWQPICVTLEQQGDPKAKGILKDLNTIQFLGVTAVLMDIMPIMTRLSLLFQRQDLDLSMVYPSITTARRDLGNLREVGAADGKHLNKFWEVSKCNSIRAKFNQYDLTNVLIVYYLSLYIIKFNAWIAESDSWKL